MRVAVMGGTGMIGRQLCEALHARGDEVLVITRRPPRSSSEVQWTAGRGVQQNRRLEGLDAVVNLNGAPLADRPWTRARREVLRDSRIRATEVLFSALENLERPPATIIGVGHLGRFGDRADEWLDDDASPGTGFLAELADEWEQVQLQAGVLGARVAVLRMGIVLSPTGGAFPLMVVPFRYGLGGWLGNGRQFTPWVSIRDCIGAMLYLMDNVECEGVFNGTVPEPVTNKEWFKALGNALGAAVRTHAPKWALRGALGELANDVFLASCRARPAKLLERGYVFIDPDVDSAFRWLVRELD